MVPSYLLNRKHQLERYALSGSLIFILGHIQYRLLYSLFQGVPMCAGMAWGLHFIIGTVWSHALHRGFTFYNEPQLTYFISLFRTCGLYSFVLVISTIMMILLCDIGGIQHRSPRLKTWPQRPQKRSRRLRGPPQADHRPHQEVLALLAVRAGEIPLRVGIQIPGNRRRFLEQEARRQRHIH